ncbi:hypothetical protein [Emticicia sp. C21]|uniref:hypothetical protein n=1 Tax=Emticicia sp. C21 TaxID=2302915 RepID=UPI000E35127E|nr:hypothetical protein [Emticicia sp. C21]RFS15034.1 hypothetical protein D0T08_18315 [Emticicia sp. C21]
MNKIITILSIILLLFWGCAKNKEVSPEKELLLKRLFVMEGSYRPPHTILEYKYSDSQLIEHTYNNYSEVIANGIKTVYSSITTSKYNYVNKLLETIVTTSETGTVAETIYYEYNAKNQIIRKSNKLSTDQNKKILYEYSYNSDGKLIEQKEYLAYPYTIPFYITKYEYEAKNAVKRSYYDPNGVLFGESRYYYDNKKYNHTADPSSDTGNIVEISGTDKYKAKDGILELTPPNQRYSAVYLIEQQINLTYNEWGYPIKREVTSKNSNSKIIFGLEYY